MKLPAFKLPVLKLPVFENRRRAVIFGLLGTVALIIVIFALLALFAPKAVPVSANLASVHTDAVKGQAGGAGTDEYNKKLSDHDSKEADKALQAGESYMPTPVGQRSSLGRKEPESKPTTPPVPQPRTAPPATRPRPVDNTLLKRMTEDLQALDARLASLGLGTGKIEFVAAPIEQPTKDKTSTPPAATTSEDATSAALALRAGDLLYAVVDTGINSDVPSAVMATITSGQFKKARLLGSFKRFEERVVLSFSRLIMPTGASVQLEAYAIDPATTEASVASSVDTHFLSRWGGLVAATFLEGLATAKRFSGAQSTIYGGYGGQQVDNQMVWNSYSPEDQAWIAAGKVGEKASEIFTKNFDRPPTVYLEAGTAIGVLILNCKAK